MDEIMEIFETKCSKYSDNQLSNGLLDMLAAESVQEYALMMRREKYDNAS